MAIFNKSRRRAVAPVVLGFWIFALVTSVAHACGLLDGLEHAGTASAVSAAAAREVPGDDALPACAKFCADDIPLLSKLKSVEDPPAESAVLVLTLASNVYLPASPRFSSAVTGPDPPPSIAINTRFIRLAL